MQPTNRCLICAILIAACGKAAIGESCSTSGSTDECTSGAICDTNASGAKVCYKACASDTDCLSTENCTGVSGSSGKRCKAK